MKARSKRQNGRYFTAGNPFRHRAFRAWAKRAKLPAGSVLEPFAGSGSLLRRLEAMGLCNKSSAFDLHPAGPGIRKRDTLASFPRGYPVCITNPPWLAKNSATVRGLDFPACQYDDLYKFALEKCLSGCGWVAALVPESFIRTGLFRSRLTDFISLTPELFTDTGHPVGLALFQPRPSPDTRVWSQGARLGLLSDLEALRPAPRPGGPRVRFNVPGGNVGLVALDNTQTASIRFCEVEELAGYRVKHTGRHITKLQVEGRVRIAAWNGFLNRFREKTHDVLMTSTKGIRKDGKYRRRLDWDLARGIVHNA